MILLDMAVQGAEILSGRGGGALLVGLFAVFFLLARWRGVAAMCGLALVLIGAPALVVGAAMGSAAWAGEAAYYLVPWVMAVLGTGALTGFLAWIGLILGPGDG